MCKEFGGDSGMLLNGDNLPLVTSDTPLFLNSLLSNVWQNYDLCENEEYFTNGFALFNCKYISNAITGLKTHEVANKLLNLTGNYQDT